ncbi:hypothetical protein ASPBRDRAFT_36937 [Aspergillus brasiliensis CBS 101740]|uniref:Uncharacterized protein n=1 Tax=Aspergillus brasiliensis (strain CBS 101740 / IMI 381727 / IBT 21946) TaxID=767769 RepID=A0A1L9V1A7_ASPBC|nr:hypothetical protein ASPBRDRAFT_36937 [Aspergillus brasiliensis CBS 101740]
MIHVYAFDELKLALLVKSSAGSDEGSGIYRGLSELRGKGVTTAQIATDGIDTY